MHLSTFLIFLLTAVDISIAKPSDAILLSKVKTITLRNGKQTSHRRVSSIPQLRCIGGSGRRHHEVDVMRCTNVGSDYDQNDIQWTCQANLPPEFKLGSTEVMCEGYDSPDDPYILKGSCGVEYKLLLTELGQRTYGHSGGEEEPLGWAGWLFLIFFFGIFAYIVWMSCTGQNRRRDPGRPGQGWGGGPGPGGGWGPGDDSDPPPPYTPGPSGSKGPSTGSSNGGFWTNTLAGAAAGYAAGRFSGGGNRHNDRYGRNAGWGGQDRWGGGGGWGGFGGGRANPPQFDRTPSSSSSSSTHQSTGFGGTTRR